MGRRRLSVVLAALAACAAPFVLPGLDSPVGPAAAQELPHNVILTIETDRLFSESAFGKRVANEIEAESAVLAAENRRMEAELSGEEKDLTARRSDMEPKAFRALADAFDEKVQGIRRTQDAKARALNAKADKARVDFLRAARPVLETLMREAGAGVILERSSVFLSANATDITAEAIRRIDATLGDGAPGDAGASTGPAPATAPGSAVESAPGRDQ
ncbi:OmpH family outer membrane protein [Pseudodonghicola flavimaris]|uniref:OmpH family outer membrane protein n=1 Tax=Pseudodonghicola flavimaris TaxID=3050036 RepID=A0ABT7F6Z6_9RHOB|nr:OmpH family outer membrane protein [Pseudodonghicola flavimaris]MDK3020379.1 OmpH family outer membrane protein [Pseudodonghicola flavimaris]